MDNKESMTANIYNRWEGTLSHYKGYRKGAHRDYRYLTPEWWALYGRLHREDGPAIEYTNGDTEWFLNGKRHRENGPARDHSSGHKEWWINGQLHRENEPAIILPNGRIYYATHGKCYNQKGERVKLSWIDTVFSGTVGIKEIPWQENSNNAEGNS